MDGSRSAASAFTGAFTPTQIQTLSEGADVFQDAQGALWVRPREAPSEWAHVQGHLRFDSKAEGLREVARGQVLTLLLKPEHQTGKALNTSEASRFNLLKREFKDGESNARHDGIERVAAQILTWRSVVQVKDPAKAAALVSAMRSSAAHSKAQASPADSMGLADSKHRPSLPKEVADHKASLSAQAAPVRSQRLEPSVLAGIRMPLRSLAIDLQRLPQADREALLGRAHDLLRQADPDRYRRGDATTEQLTRAGQTAVDEFRAARSSALPALQSEELKTQMAKTRLASITAALTQRLDAAGMLESHQGRVASLAAEADRLWLQQHAGDPAALTVTKEQVTQIVAGVWSRMAAARGDDA